MTAFDRDALIRTALSPTEAVQAPPDLADAVYAEVLQTPQRRSILPVGPFRWLPSPSPSLVALLLLALLSIGLALAILSRQPAVPPRLATYHGGPERSGVMPGPAPTGAPVLAWRAERKGSIPFTVMPLVADGRVVIVDDGGWLAALDETTGDLLWEVDIGSPIRATPVILGDLVVVGAGAGVVQGRSMIDGNLRWEYLADVPVTASLAATPTEVYVSGEDGTLTALDPITAAERWSLDLGGPINRGPAISGGLLYVGTTGGRFMAVDLARREVDWDRDLSPGGIGTPAVAGGRVVFGHGLELDPGNRELIALDARTGDDLWSFPGTGTFQVHVGAIGDAFTYAISEDTNVYALDPDTGRQRWAFSTDGPIGTLCGLVDDGLYVGSADGTVRAIDAVSGVERWSFPVDGTPTVPAVINGRVIVGTSFGLVVAIAGGELTR